MRDLELNLTTVVILLVFIFTIFVDVDSPSSPQEIVIDKARSEGFVAFIVNEKSVDSEGGDVQNECECNGTKELIHGDGHKTPCPCTESPEGCKCKSQSTQPVEKKEVIIQELKTCPPQRCPPTSNTSVRGSGGRWGFFKRVFRR